MTKRFQFGVVLATATLGLSLLGATTFAQNPHPDRPPKAQTQAPKQNTNRPPVSTARPSGANNGRNSSSDRPPSRQTQPPNSNPNRPASPTTGPGLPESFAPNGFNNRPGVNPNTGPADRPGTSYDRPSGPTGGPRMSPRQQIGVGSPRPFVDQMRDMSPQQRERQLQSSKAFQNLAPEQQNRIRNQFNQWDRMSPQQRSDLREKENTWRNLTPQQRDHIKNDVLPQWRQLPWQRQQAIQQKLGVLQNMPESARNRRLADPNFTRGMSDEDRAMLHDLSHLHVGGAPDPPATQP